MYFSNNCILWVSVLTIFFDKILCSAHSKIYKAHTINKRNIRHRISDDAYMDPCKASKFNLFQAFIFSFQYIYLNDCRHVFSNFIESINCRLFSTTLFGFWHIEVYILCLVFDSSVSLHNVARLRCNM